MQNKLIASCILLLSLAANASYAGTDAFAAYIGGAWWQTEGTGNMKIYGKGVILDIDISLQDTTKQSNAYAFLTIEHTINYLPNLSISSGTMQQNVSGVINISGYASMPASGKIDLINTDLTGFYRPVNIAFFQLDLGLTLRILNGDLTTDIFAATSDISSTLPLFYINSIFIIPNTGVKFNINTNIGDSGKDSTKDLSTAMSYESPNGLGATMGYRHFKASLNSTGVVPGQSIEPKITADILIKGPYLGLFYHF